MRGLRTKLKDLSHSVLSSNYDVIFLTETWLSSDFTDSELGMEGYRVFRRDRDSLTSDKIMRGGVLIAVRNSFKAHVLPTVNVDLEQIFVILDLSSNSVILSNVYIPPISISYIYEKYSNDLELISDRFPIANHICCGDFNAPGDCWSPDRTE